MRWLKLLILELGALLVYAGVSGRSVTALLKGDSTVTSSNASLISSSSDAAPASSQSTTAGASGYAPGGAILT